MDVVLFRKTALCVVEATPLHKWNSEKVQLCTVTQLSTQLLKYVDSCSKLQKLLHAMRHHSTCATSLAPFPGWGGCVADFYIYIYTHTCTHTLSLYVNIGKNTFIPDVWKTLLCLPIYNGSAISFCVEYCRFLETCRYQGYEFFRWTRAFVSGVINKELTREGALNQRSVLLPCFNMQRWRSLKKSNKSCYAFLLSFSPTVWPLTILEAWILVWPGELLRKMRLNYLALGGFLHKASKTLSSNILPIIFMLT